MTFPTSILDWVEEVVAQALPEEHEFNFLLEQSQLNHRQLVQGLRDSGNNRKGVFLLVKMLMRVIDELRPLIKRWVSAKKSEASVDKPSMWLIAILNIVNLSLSTSHSPVEKLGLVDLQNVASNASPIPGSFEEMLQIAWNAASRQVPTAINALAEDFCVPYMGSGPLRLHTELCGFPQKHEHCYAAVLPILQSSGVGKTRTVAELSAHAPGVMICLRPGTSKGSRAISSLPKQDETVYNFLSKEDFYSERRWLNQINKTHWIDHCKVAALLGATATVIADQLAKAHQAIKGRQRNNKDERTTWQLVVEQISHIFFDDMVPGYRVGVTTPHSSPKQSHSQASSVSLRQQMINGIAETALLLANTFQREIPEEHESDMSYAADVAEKLARSVSAKFEGFDQYKEIEYIFLALDEFDTFNHLLGPARRLMSNLTDCPFRLLLLDTNNKLAHVAGPAANMASQRTTDGTKMLPDPYLIISQDVRLRQSEQRQSFESFLAGDLPHTHESMLMFLPLMGRPLWGDRAYQSKGSIAGISLGQVLAKMIAIDRSPEQENQDPNEQSDEQKGQYIALAACRLPLNIIGAQGSSNSGAFIQDQITRHLRWVIGFENSGDLVSTVALSEPIMSLAAAHQHRRSNKESCLKRWANTITAIRDKQSAGCLMIGENGEEFVRILLTIAMDIQALDAPNVQPADLIPKHIGMIHLGKVLESIFGVLPLGTAMGHRNMIDNSWVNFTHFLRVSSQPCETTDLVYLWSRQAAAIGVVNQEAWDILIPVYYTGSNVRPPSSDMFDRKNMRFVMIQVKVDPSQTFTQAVKPDYKRAMRNEAVSAGALSLCLFVNLARNYENKLHEKGEMALIYLGGNDTKRFPLINEFKHRNIRTALFGLIGRRAKVRQSCQNVEVGSEQWSEMNARLGLDGRWFMENASTAESSGKQPQQDATLIKPATEDVSMGVSMGTESEMEDRTESLATETDHDMQ